MITCVFEDGTKTSLRHVVVHMIVEKDGKLLLVKHSPKLLEGGKWSLPSGFLDRGETAVECAVRELKEETGWVGETIALFRVNTNPDRPHEDRQNVSFDFIVKPIRKAGEGDWESTDIRWFPIDQLPPLDSMAFDHGESIGLYLKYRQRTFSIPLIN